MKNNPKNSRQAGFALVVTLSLMILLTVIAVGLLTLSSISLRSAAQGNAKAVASSNARLAMMLALGELQSALGPDRAVSAPASAVFQKTNRPRLTGAWRAAAGNDPAWHWSATANGSPSYSDKKAASAAG